MRIKGVVLLFLLMFTKGNAQFMNDKTADQLQFVPAISFATISLFEHHDQHFIEDMKLLSLTTVTLAGSVKALKNITQIERPDHSSFHSFPSGHTAVSFMGAEMIRMKYPKKVQLWLPNYLIATAVGIERVQSNHHRPFEVICGAAIGIIEVHLVKNLYEKYREKRAKKRGLID